MYPYKLLTAVGHEHIPQPPYRLNEHRLGGIGLDKLAQTRNLDIEAAVEGFVLAAPCKFHELVARQRDLGVAGEHFQNGELARGDGDGFVVLGERTGGKVQYVRTELDGFVFLAGGAGMFFGTPAAQDGVDTGEQFARIEGLGQVVVGPHFQTHDAVDFFGLGREYDDGRVVVPATQAPADRQTVFARQHQVKHQQVEVFTLPELAHFLRVFCHEDIEPLLGQIPAQEITQAGIVVDDQDFAGKGGVLCVHGRKCNRVGRRREVAVATYYILCIR